MIGFLEWAGVTPTLFPIEWDMTRQFVRGLTFPLHLASKHLIEIDSTFPQMVSHVRAMEHDGISPRGRYRQSGGYTHS